MDVCVTLKIKKRMKKRTTENIVARVNIQSKVFHIPGELELVELDIKD